jgi:hypothetical protein
MYVRIAIVVLTCPCVRENFDMSAPLFDVWNQSGVVKGQRRRRDPFFFQTGLGELACLPVSIIIRPVRRQNCVPTHWARK